ncbi:hypothetical protein [Sandaracinobacter neustonicus]|uniref:hypothetical protein n=1 Tax=Sandaracinobacter neustonicus TaxID=1715348 RepID=UPI0015E2B219|nr:hypothetical protein [Sandaracinobacter neustonicus]
MSRSVLTIFCAAQDAEAIAAALRACTHVPIHVRREDCWAATSTMRARASG